MMNILPVGTVVATPNKDSNVNSPMMNILVVGSYVPTSM
jgi:hypothetical protein